MERKLFLSNIFHGQVALLGTSCRWITNSNLHRNRPHEITARMNYFFHSKAHAVCKCYGFIYVYIAEDCQQVYTASIIIWVYIYMHKKKPLLICTSCQAGPVNSMSLQQFARTIVTPYSHLPKAADCNQKLRDGPRASISCVMLDTVGHSL